MSWQSCWPRDLAVALYDLAIGRRRREYRDQVIVKAPPEILRRLLMGSDITYERADVRVVTAPLPGVEGVEVPRQFIGGRPYASVAVQRSEPMPRTFVCRCLAELSEHAAWIGADDVCEVSLEPLPDGVTRMRLVRTLTHRRARTRISAPMAVRQSAWLLKTQAEKEAGHAPARWQPRLAHLLWVLAALASFWWLVGWWEAAILTLVIIVHELGHAAAMVATGQGVRFITLVPFFGGMAAPKRHYESEWQCALVALMGPSLSLIPTLALFWFATSGNSAMAARVAFMFAIINAPNLLPVVPLDGGVIFHALLRSAHARSSQAIAWLGVAAVLGLAVYFQSILIGIVFMFGAWQLVYRTSLEVNDKVEPLGRLQGFVLLAAFALTGLAYWTILEQSYASPQIFLEKTDRAHCRVPEARTAPGEVRLTGRAAPCQ
jgi:Zn-dependent protease